jgi:sugar O-acyltransferase (sialic acid O-acetyltransferase NeuD family)
MTCIVVKLLMKEPIIIVGIENLAHLALEILQRNDMVIYGLLAEKKSTLTAINHIPILGSLEEDATYIEKLGKDCAIFVAIQQTHTRQRYIQALNNHHLNSLINVIHPSAEIASTASIGTGNLLDGNAQLSPNVHLGNHCLIHKQVVIDSNAAVHDFVQIGPGSIIGEQVTIEADVFIGAGVTIIPGLHVGQGAQIGAGSVVLENVKPKERILGNPAKSFKIHS